jgi:hypothetical protein
MRCPQDLTFHCDKCQPQTLIKAVVDVPAFVLSFTCTVSKECLDLERIQSPSYGIIESLIIWGISARVLYLSPLLVPFCDSFNPVRDLFLWIYR